MVFGLDLGVEVFAKGKQTKVGDLAICTQIDHR